MPIAERNFQFKVKIFKRWSIFVDQGPTPWDLGPRSELGPIWKSVCEKSIESEILLR